MWLRGEHDISTDGALCQALGRGIALDRSGVVLDLSAVKLMSASTLGVILAARELLSRQSRASPLRCPSAFVRRIIGVCAFDDLVGQSPEEGYREPGEALTSWVAVPVSGGADQPGPSLTLAPDRLPEHVGHAAHLATQATVEPKQLADIV